MSQLPGPRIDKPVAERSAQLLADNAADDDAEELETDFLGVEAKLGKEELGDLDGDEDGGEPEDNGIGDGGNQDAGVASEEEGLDKLNRLERFGVDATEIQVLLLEGGTPVFDAATHVAGFGTEEKVKNELNAINLRSVSLGLVT